MLSHVALGANDLEASKVFYDAVLGALGHGPGMAAGERYLYMHDGQMFLITRPLDGQPASHGNGSTIGFTAGSPEQIDASHAAGVANGGISCEEPPGVRETARGKLYLAYLRDPSGNKICLIHRMS